MKPTTNPRYPAPDRSSFTPNEHIHDEVLPEGDLGAGDILLQDGRPCRVEAWFSEGATFITLFFSTLDLDGATAERLLALVSPVLEDEDVPVAWRRLSASDVKTIADARGNSMYSLTFVVREPDL